MNETNTCTIWTFGSPVLRKKAKKVENFDDSLKKISKRMVRDLYISNGIGLAAPQVGLSMQLIVIDLQSHTQDTVTLDGRVLPMELLFPFCFTNPTYTPVNDVQEVKEEGCLSLPSIVGPVKRHYEIVLTYQDLDGNDHCLQCNNLMARCVQHECDHLRGVLFIDHLSKKARREQKDALDEIKGLGGQFTYYQKKEEDV